MLREGGALETNITGVCGECSQCLGHTGFAPAQGGVCVFLVYAAQAPGCSAGELCKVGPELRALLRSKPLKFRLLGTLQRHRLGWACVLCPSQVRAAQMTRCLAVRLITSLVPAAWFPVCAAGVLSQVCHVSPLGSWSQAATLLADVNNTGPQEDLVSNWSLFAVW